MSERKMATIRRIDNIEPIEGADAVECAVLGGWRVVVRKGEYEVGDWAVYCEIDSFVPHEIAPFLSHPDKGPKTYNGVEGNTLKTKKIRGQISQGLLLPLSIHWDVQVAFHEASLVDDSIVDVSETLGIQKWERPDDASLGGCARGSFPTHLAPKTDEERIQNMRRNYEKYQELGYTFEVTEKAEGSSTSIIHKDGDIHVCSRNLSVKENEDNTFWKVAKKYDVHNKIANLGMNFAIQGETIGPKIQDNIYQLNSHDLLVYKIFDVDNQRFLSPEERISVCKELGLNHVPIINQNLNVANVPYEDILSMADGYTEIGNNREQLREGLVFKCNEDPSISFKVVSNKYLEKQKY